MTRQRTQALSYKRGSVSDLPVLGVIIAGRGLGKKIDSSLAAVVVTSPLN